MMLDPDKRMQDYLNGKMRWVDTLVEDRSIVRCDPSDLISKCIIFKMGFLETLYIKDKQW